MKIDTSLDDPLPTLDSEEDHGSPRALLSDVDWAVKAAEQGNGGLRNAVKAAEKSGFLPDKMWVGTLGMPTDSLKDETRASISEILGDAFESLTVFVGDSEFEGHYSHFCRMMLWPALHYQMQESPRHTEYDDYAWKQYVKINEAFAQTIAAYWHPGDSIWVHDYHLMLLPSLLREKLPTAEIGFFMHSSFPSSEVFRCLNSREALLYGLLGADLVGFQTDEYCHHFLQACSRLLRLEVSVDGVQLQRRLVHVKTTPMGIDVEALDELRRFSEVKDWISNIGSRYKGKHLVVARDRLDASGGIKQKLLAYELFLKKYPKWRQNVWPPSPFPNRKLTYLGRSNPSCFGIGNARTRGTSLPDCYESQLFVLNSHPSAPGLPEARHQLFPAIGAHERRGDLLSHQFKRRYEPYES